MIRIVVEGDVRDPEAVISPALLGAMNASVELLIDQVQQRTPVGATGIARGSITGEVRGAPIGRGEVAGIVGSPLKYVEVLERGRRPGQKAPPTAPLELWVRRKLGVKDVKESRQIAFAISRSIARKGTEGAHMFEEAVRDNETRIHQIFERAGARIAIEMNRAN